jgi:hypothetical protein
LTGGAIDWEKRTLTVNKTLEFRRKQQDWRAGPPKTATSYRTGEPAKNSSYDPHLYKLCDEAGIKTTMDRYVHVTDEPMNKAVQQFETLFA